MSYWDSETGRIERTAPAPYGEAYPGWLSIDCGCCAGIEWGDPGPRECRRCGGNGSLAQHVVSGTIAQYPGGPLCGRLVAGETNRT